MDTIFEFIDRALKKVTANPNPNLEKLQDCRDEFINHELRKLTEIENGRPLKPSEEEREGILLYERMSPRSNTE